MKTSIVGVILAGALLAGLHAQAEEQDKVATATAAADQWVALVDAGRYADSWTEGSGYFKGAVSQAQWEQAVKAIREPLGVVVSRTVKSATFATSLPGAPDGEYVVIVYETVFENKQAALETVTPMRDADGTWRISGYFIK